MLQQCQRFSARKGKDESNKKEEKNLTQSAKKNKYVDKNKMQTVGGSCKSIADN